MKASAKQLAKYATEQEKMRQERIKMVATGVLPKSELSRDEKNQLANKLIEYKRKLGLQDLFFFCKHILGYQDMSDMHEELCNFVTLKKKSGGPFTNRLILEPRGSFKSSVVTIGYALWRVLREPNLRVLIDSEEFGKSKAFLREIRDHIVHNDEFRRLYGKLDSKKYTDIWQEHQFNVSTRTKRTKEPNFSCAGIDVTKVGMHYDLIIGDDLVSDKNITTPEQMEKTVKHYKLLLSLLDPGCELVFIGTRWHFGDLYGYILDEDAERVHDGKNPVWKKLIRPARYRDGKLLFPERLTNAFLSSMRQAQGSYIFSCQYLNDPAGAEDAAFKGDWVEWFTELPKVPLSFAILVDPSVGQSKESDYSAVVSVAVDPLNNWYVLNVDRGHWNPTEIVNAITNARRRIIQTHSENQPNAKRVRVALEVVAFQKVLKFYAKDLMRRKEVERFRIIELKTDTRVSKEMRIRGMVPQFEDHRVFFRGISERKCSAGIKQMYQELLHFPVGKHRDTIDALAYLPQILQIPNALEAPKPKETIFSRIRRSAMERDPYRGEDQMVVGSRIGRRDPWQGS
jgi:predicted phage terminase large subunit-like protein